ncbi:hypothetical protein ALC56_01997 [Trachymyrmex septentrionalis]|uniref:Uncharacterized protein n=1 Tax=Trachymyrmex septentrionalis TaxID=34720 RepID=A0A195FT14_9HYME|nr:hypothetical protein ALC56_01997 [Trachymyrmex septentrionalis]
MIAIYTKCKVPARSQFVKLNCCSVTFAGLVAHIIYRRKKTEEEKVKRRRRTKPKAGTESGKESERRRKRKREGPRCFLGLRRAYCVILATVAAATAGIIIISKGGQNTGPKSHNAEFYDFWHRGDATGCNAAFYALLTAPDLISRPEMNGFSKRNELLSVNTAAECCKLSRRPKTVHRHATREIIVLSRDLAAMNEGVHGSHLPSSLPLYKLHDDVTWFNLNT